MQHLPCLITNNFTDCTMDIVRETASTLAALQSPFFSKTDSIENISAWLEGYAF